MVVVTAAAAGSSLWLGLLPDASLSPSSAVAFSNFLKLLMLVWCVCVVARLGRVAILGKSSRLVGVAVVSTRLSDPEKAVENFL